MLLILGNGFDLDLGLKTSYRDFFESEKWPFFAHDWELGKYLHSQIKSERWYDLERLLGLYARNRRIEKVDFWDKHDYDILVEQIRQYLSDLSYENINENSYAVRILKASQNCLLPADIVSFNYTDVQKVAERFDLTCKEVEHVHGSLRDGHIILGVGDYEDLLPGIDFMYKSNNEYYNPPRLAEKLMMEDDVVIFGLSMSQVDYPYFETFFNSIINASQPEQRKSITFITYDEASRVDILRNLRQMNQGKISQMMTNNRIRFFRTSIPQDLSPFEDFLNQVECSVQLDFDTI